MKALFFSFLFLFFAACARREGVEGKNTPVPSAVLPLRHARAFEVAYDGPFKIVTVKTPWRGARKTLRYLLTAGGASVPSAYRDLPAIAIPANKVIVTSTAFLPDLENLGLLSRLVGASDLKFTCSQGVRARIDSGKIAEVGAAARLDVEKVAGLSPDLLIAYGMGDPEYDVHERLDKAAIRTVLNASYMEETPLGRAEWIKFTAAFFNAESLAEIRFAEIESEYDRLRNLTRNLSYHPAVLVGSEFAGVWHVPGGRSFTAQLIADAGGKYLWEGDTTTGGVPFTFEAIYGRAAEADLWINVSSWKRLADGSAEDSRYVQFKPFRDLKVYNNNARTNAEGGNDFYEAGVAEPHRVLADLIAILHPSLLPGHELYFYRRLER